MIKHFQKWWAIHAAWILTFLVVPLLPAAQNLVAHNPKATVVLAGISTIVAKLTNPPNH